MKKRLLGISMVAAALTLSTSMTAFAGWVKDRDGYRYQRADGTYQGWGWFTDPDTGLEYYMDLGGYTMTHTHVEGYWLDDDGVKHEKTEEEIAAEQARATRERNSKNPGNKSKDEQEEAAATIAAGDIALATTRNTYQTEMQVYTNRAFVTIKKALTAADNTSYVGDVSEDNQQSTFYYDNSNSVRILYSTFWKNSTKTSENYVPYAYEMNYNRNVVHGDDAAYFAEAFQFMIKAALGENEGTAVYDKVMAVEVGSDDKFELSGTTDTGNYYELTYKNNNANIKVTCSEIVPETEDADAEEEEEENEENTESVETTAESSASSVITAGTGNTSTDTEETATAVDEDDDEDEDEE
jgi:hypothetical protein